MEKAEIMSLLGHEGKEWNVKEIGIKRVSTTIPYMKNQWESLIFHNFTEQEVCELLDREFILQLKEQLPLLVEKCHEYAKENKLYREWYKGIPTFRFCGVNVKKNYKQSFFMLEFDAGDDPDEFQSELMISIGFDRNFSITGEIQEESIWR